MLLSPQLEPQLRQRAAARFQAWHVLVEVQTLELGAPQLPQLPPLLTLLESPLPMPFLWMHHLAKPAPPPPTLPPLMPAPQRQRRRWSL